MQFAKRIIFFLLPLLSVNLYAQPLYQQKMNGPYLLLYKLTDKQMEFVAKHPEKIDSQFLYTRLVGKVHTDSIIPLFRQPIEDFPIHPFSDKNRYAKCWPRFHVWDIKENGYFIEVTVNTLNTVSYKIIENPLFNAGVHRIGYETFVFVEDTAGLPVYNASVHLDTSNCPYDSSIGGYKIAGKNIFGFLRIERNGIFTLSHLNGYQDKTNNTQPPKDRYNYAKIKYQGYLVTNKPRYKQWDTLFFKSFLVNTKGKPIKEKLIARLYQNYSGYAREIEIKPANKGDYHGYIIINDSFTLDQPITMALLTEQRTTVKYQNIMLENYELKDIFFEFRADKALVTPGEGIKFYASATTANRLPIMDGKLTFKMRLSNVNFTDGDSVVIPFKKMENWYSVSVQTDPSGVTVFEIPDSVFMPLDGTFEVRCILLTADNEMREGSGSFRYQTTRDRQEANLESDTLRVKRLYNMESVQRTMRIKIYSKKDLLVDSVFQTPLNLYLPPNVFSANIYKGDTLTGTFYRQTTLPEVWGKRTYDSANIYFKSAKDIPVFYRIYCNNILVAKGKSTQLNWHTLDKKKASYHIQYGILEGSVTSPRFYSKSFHLAEKELKVEIIQPTTVYPGQEVAIEIFVKNAYGKPVNKVNLAAWAVNTQMESITTPDIPYMGLVKTQKPLPTQNWPLYKIELYSTSALKPWQIGGFFLRKNKVFNLVYPEKGFQVLTDTTPHKSTEIDFYAHGKSVRQQIQWVKMNDTFLSIFPNGGQGSAVKRIKSGTYKFEIRTFDRVYQFKNVRITEGKKNFLCFHLDSLDLLKIGDTTNMGMLTEEEIKSIYNHTLVYRYDNVLYDTFIVKINGKTQWGYPYGSILQNANKFVQLSTNIYTGNANRNKFTTQQNYMLLGPVNEGDEIELIWKNGYSHLIKFKPGNAISFTKNDQVVDVLKNWAENVKYIQAQNYLNYNLNTFWFDPYYKDTTKPKPAIPPPYEPQHYPSALPEFQYTNYSPNQPKQVYNSLMHLYISSDFNPIKLWLFNRQDSSFSNLENYSSFGNNYADIGMNARRNLWTIAPAKQRQEYKMVLEVNDTTWLVNNISIDSSVNLFLTLNPKQFRKLGQREYIFYDRLAKNLTREALIKWIDTPSVNKGLVVIPLRGVKGSTSIEGTVIGPGIKFPVENAFVVLERNGVFVSGAFTNREGRFNMDNLLPGTYMLKIKGEKYHYWLHYALEIKAGFNHLVQAEMKPYAWFTYNNILYDQAEIGETTFEPMANGYGVKDNGRGGNAPRMAYEKKMSPGKMIRSDAIGSYSLDAISMKTTESIFHGFLSVNKPEVAFEENFLDTEYSLGWASANQKREEDRMNLLAGDNNAKKTRKDFKDYAYWKPSFYTNKQGKAGFSVKYPDNVTSWRTFVPAMDGKRHSGLGDITVKSYKPIVTTLALPLFLTEGDSLMAYGKIMNYTGKNITGKYNLKYNQIALDKDISFKDFYTDSMRVIGSKPGDTLSVESAFELANGYRDAEMRKIWINAASVIGGKSSFDEILLDTSLTFKADSGDIGMEVVVYNHKLALILDMLKQIENLPAYDNHSLAHFLTALLIKKSVCNALSIPFLQDKQIKETMSKIKKSQSDDGFFGWFKGSKSTFMVSTAVADAMFRADQMGFENNTWLNTAKNMEKQLPQVSGMERLEYLLCLKNMKRTLNYDSFMKIFSPSKLDISNKLKLYRLQQLLGKKVPVSEINGLMQTTPEGNLMMAGSWDWRYAPVTDDVSNTFKAWQILFDAKATSGRRKALVNYMGSESNSYGNSWIHAAEALVAEAMNDSSIKKELTPEVYANGELVSLRSMPKKYTLKPGETLNIKHKGAPVYIASNRKFKTDNPVSDANEFKITCNIPAAKQNQLTAGEPVEMKVTVFAKRNQFNAVIDIPIPAGCVYKQKIQGESYFESHREYLTDRVLIFSDELPFGYHTFTVYLVPKFNGTFYTAPARTALMFYPDKAAYTAKQRWSIGR